MTTTFATLKPGQSIDSLLRESREPVHLLVVGAGIAGLTAVVKVLNLARDYRCDLKITLVYDADECTSSASGGLEFPFISSDPRTAGWAMRSFEDIEVADTTGLGEYRHRNTMLVVGQKEIHLPPGHAGNAQNIDPQDYGLGFYPYGKRLDAGAINSTCELIPKLRSWVSEQPEVSVQRLHLRHIHHLIRYGRDVEATAVIVAAGDRARFLVGDTMISGDIGVLLNGALDQIPELYRHGAIMDEDKDSELTYMIPHQKCGHAKFGGVAGHEITEPWEWEEIRRGNLDLAAAPEFVRDAIEEIADRIHQRMPVLAAALPARPTDPGQYWIGIRPRSASVAIDWLPDEMMLDDLPILHIGGLGGSGFTITYAVVDDALRYACRPIDEAGGELVGVAS